MESGRIREAARGRTVAVILGDGLSSRSLALKLSLLYDVQCVICDREKSYARIIIPAGIFYRLCDTRSDELLAFQLEDILKECSSDFNFLIVEKSGYEQEVSGIRQRLESKFVVTDKDGIFDYLKADKPRI